MKLLLINTQKTDFSEPLGSLNQKEPSETRGCPKDVTETIHLLKEELKGWGSKVKSKGARKRVEG